MADYGIRMDLGDYEGTVVSTELVSLGQNATPALKVRVNVNGETLEPVIWMTPKAMGMARQALKAIGFDPDTQDMDALDTMPTLLKGNACVVRVIEDDFGGRLKKKAEIVFGSGAKRVEKSKLSALQEGLRAAKSKDESPVVVKKSAAPAERPALDDIPF